MTYQIYYMPLEKLLNNFADKYGLYITKDLNMQIENKLKEKIRKLVNEGICEISEDIKE